MLSKKNRILMTGDAIGGVWTYVCELAKGIGKYNFEIVLALMGDPPSKHQYDQICSIGNVTLCYQPYRLEWMENPWKDVGEAGEWLLSLQKMYVPDIVQINGYAHVSLPWNVPVLCAAHSCVYSWFSHVKKKLPDSSWDEYKKKVQKALLSASVVVTPSQSMLADLKLHYGEIKNYKVIYNGRSKVNFGCGKKEPVIFASGRIWDEAKNLKLLFDISRNFEWPLYVAGAGKIGEGRETCLGLLSESEMISWFNKASIYIHTALYEPFGLSVLEAAYGNCALILSDIESLREIWKGEAMYINPHSTEEIISTVAMLIKNKALLTEYAQRANLQSQRYSCDSMCKEYVKAYKDYI
jgi:glycosyltransferase involved in cell wall biosynthesis